jgi:hypothetical protein
MLFYSTIRCIIYYLLLTTFLVNSHDLFDMFNDVKDQVVDYASSKVKQQVQKHVFNVVCLFLLFLFNKLNILERW